MFPDTSLKRRIFAVTLEAFGLNFNITHFDEGLLPPIKYIFKSYDLRIELN